MHTPSSGFSSGFSLIELMVVVAIIAVLTTIGVPIYQDYSVKANVIASLAEASRYKTAVALCYIEQGSFSDCDGGSLGVPAAHSRISTVESGKIVLNPEVDCDQDTTTTNSFTLQPSVSSDGAISWAVTDDASQCGRYL
ncbi:pilin [Vibrio rhodolitus]|uniref:pilin n=1 Tax=Vibrio rhodolitus TaxID=2231649 RepID=UPI000E0B4C44|nr:prepilin-type N-terminal cleavage/methylation domain-containing protein [Vibrio rhodolitus]